MPKRAERRRADARAPRVTIPGQILELMRRIRQRCRTRNPAITHDSGRRGAHGPTGTRGLCRTDREDARAPAPCSRAGGIRITRLLLAAMRTPRRKTGRLQLSRPVPGAEPAAAAGRFHPRCRHGDRSHAARRRRTSPNLVAGPAHPRPPGPNCDGIRRRPIRCRECADPGGRDLSRISASARGRRDRRGYATRSKT